MENFFENGKLFVGINYWESKSAINMWENFDETIIESDFKKMSDAGITILRIFPIWSVFQPIKAMRDNFGVVEYRLGEEPFPDTEAGKAGVSEEACRKFEVVCKLAEKYNLKLIVGLLTGHMSGRYYAPPAFEGRNPISDPTLVKWEIRFIRYFVSRMKKFDAIAGWDLGNECCGFTPAGGFDKDTLLETAAYVESYSNHPISKSLKQAYAKEIDTSKVSDIEEISGHGVTAVVDGRKVAAGNRKLMNRMGIAFQQPDKVGTEVHVAIDGVYAGYILISDVVKPNAKKAVAELKKAGVDHVIMLTGDAKPVADAVAKELGLDEAKSELLPADKVKEVEKLLETKDAKEILAFVGDGINDAPVLSRADLGIAMGAMGSDAAIEAADIVLMDDDPAKIATAMKISRKTLRIVHQNIVFALAVKALCLLFGAIGFVNMWWAIFADVGVMIIAVLNATRALKYREK